MLASLLPDAAVELRLPQLDASKVDSDRVEAEATVVDRQLTKLLCEVFDCCHSALEEMAEQLQHQPNWKEHHALEKIGFE